MGAFFVAFDRLQRRKRNRWGQLRSTEDQIPPQQRVETADKELSRVQRYMHRDYGYPQSRFPEQFRLFTVTTRHYLRRRAAGYFRRMGFQRPGDYIREITRSIARFEDDDISSGENYLDTPGLMRILFYESDVLDFSDRAYIGLQQGRALSELTAAPRFPDLWKDPAVAEFLFATSLAAKSRLVRATMFDLLRAHHGRFFDELSVENLLTMLEHEEEDVQVVGAEMLEGSNRFGTLRVDDWMRLLRSDNIEVLENVCRAMVRHVDESRLTLDQCVTLACARPIPVVDLAFEFLKRREIKTASDFSALSALSDATCEARAENVCDWALGVIGARESYDVENITPFFDSLFDPIRRSARKWLDGLTWLWSAVLLAVHRGGRQKLKAVRQLGDSIVRDPDTAEVLLPVIGVAIRSIRSPESLAAIASVASVAERRTELVAVAEKHFPELKLTVAGAGGN